MFTFSVVFRKSLARDANGASSHVNLQHAPPRGPPAALCFNRRIDFSSSQQSELNVSFNFENWAEVEGRMLIFTRNCNCFRKCINFIHKRANSRNFFGLHMTSDSQTLGKYRKNG